MAADTLFIQFARLPRTGGVKRRLWPALGPEKACDLHRQLMEWTCGQLLGAGLGRVELWLSEEGADPSLDRCRALGLGPARLQRGADLGERMYHAFADGLARYDRVILVGSDCPGIDRDYLTGAAQALDRSEAVVGPALDGGYVLLGLGRLSRELFRGVSWGESTVFTQTVARLDQLRFDWLALEPLEDIDRPQDLAVLESHPVVRVPAVEA